MKRRKVNQSIVYLGATFILMMLGLLIIQACSPSVSTPKTTVITVPTSTQTIITSITTKTGSTTTRTTTPSAKSTPTSTSTTASSTTASTNSTTTSTGEVEATEFQGTKLTPIKAQLLNGIEGTLNINQATYTLTIEGMVDHPITFTYADLEALPQISVLATLECVEGWSYTAKWTGPSLAAILAQAGIQSGSVIAIFDTADDPDGFTSLDLSYIDSNNIILALKDNDITLPAANGFPVRVVATGKYGYKWAKWVTSIDVSSDTSFLGYWESNGYNNDGSVTGPAGQ